MRMLQTIRFSALALALTACGGAAQEGDVLGRWDRPRDGLELPEGYRLEFFKGGRLLVGVAGMTAHATWEMLEPGRILISYGDPVSPTPAGDYTVRVQGDSLFLCGTNGSDGCLRFARPGSPAQQAAEARRYESAMHARQAEGALRKGRLVQQAYWGENGQFVTAEHELRELGWAELARPPHYDAPRVVVTANGELCLEMEPLTADLWPVHIGMRGEPARGPC